MGVSGSSELQKEKQKENERNKFMLERTQRELNEKVQEMKMTYDILEQLGGVTKKGMEVGSSSELQKEKQRENESTLETTQHELNEKVQEMKRTYYILKQMGVTFVLVDLEEAIDSPHIISRDYEYKLAIFDD